MNPDEINAARLQDARDDSDPGPDDDSGGHSVGPTWDEIHRRQIDADYDYSPLLDPNSPEHRSWRDRYDTREEFEGNR